MPPGRILPLARRSNQAGGHRNVRGSGGWIQRKVAREPPANVSAGTKTLARGLEEGAAGALLLAWGNR